MNDHLRYGDIRYYRHKQSKKPNINRLTNRGIKFTDYLFENDKKIKPKNVIPKPERPDGEVLIVKNTHYIPNLFTPQLLKFIEPSKNKLFFLYFSKTILYTSQHDVDHCINKGMKVHHFGIYRNKFVNNKPLNHIKHAFT